MLACGGGGSAGSPENNSPVAGTWGTGTTSVTFTGSDWIRQENDINESQGTYAWTDTTLTITTTHVWDTETSSWVPCTPTVNEYSYGISGDTLILANGSGTLSFTKEDAENPDETTAPAYSATIGSQGTGNGQFVYPTDVACDSSGNIYVVDQGNGRIQKFNSSGIYVSQIYTFSYTYYPFGSPSTYDDCFDYPFGIAVAASGNIYITDSGHNRIVKFDSSGTYVTSWGWGGPGTGDFAAGTGDGEFDNPTGIAVDSSENVYVCDSNNNRVQKFDSSGNFITSWGTEGTGDGQFDYPAGISIDGSGNVYVADWNNNRVQKFSAAGGFIAKWGTSGTGNGQFSNPSDIAFDSAGNIYVVDRSNSRVQKFDSSGTFIVTWGTQGSGSGQFWGPRGIAINSSGNIYVADWNNSRVQVYTSSSDDSGGDGDDDGTSTVPVSGTITATINGTPRTSTYTAGMERIYGYTGWYYSLTFRNSASTDYESSSYYPSIEIFMMDDERLAAGYTYDFDDFGDGSSISQCGFHYQATSPYVDNVWYGPDWDNSYSFSITISSWDPSTRAISGSFTGTLVKWGGNDPSDQTTVTCSGTFSSQGY